MGIAKRIISVGLLAFLLYAAGSIILQAKKFADAIEDSLETSGRVNVGYAGADRNTKLKINMDGLRK